MNVDPRPALELALTRDEAGRDGIGSAADLAGWLEAHRDLVGPAGPEVALRVADFRSLHRAVRALLAAAVAGEPMPAEAVRALNEASQAVPTHPRLDDSDPRAPRAVQAGSGGSRTAEILATIARSAIGLLGGPDRARLRSCPRCGRYFLAARAGRVWCSDACGNRARVARHRARAR